MQELQPVPGLPGRLFGGGGGGSSAAEVRCPRCDSPDTKFCYYNNYNLAQPRHFCRACRRYWTKGGHLRNVPVGGGCRKPKPRRPAAAAASKDGGAHGAYGKAPRSGCAGYSPAAAGDAPATGASSSIATEPSGARSGDMRALLVPPLAPMFADQASVFASLFAPPRPHPAFGFSPQQRKPPEGAASLPAEQPPPATTSAGDGTSQLAAGSDGAAGASAWPTAASFAGMFELSGGIDGDASSSLQEYWSSENWPEYLP